MLKNTHRACTLLAVFFIAACGQEPASNDAADSAATAAEAMDTAAVPADDLGTKLASDSRPQADRDRDAGRKPADVIEFLGIEPGMSVIDIIAAGGWYTEVLAIAVGPDGQVVAQNPDTVLQMRDGANDKALTERLANDRLPNVTRLDKNFQELSAADGQFDAAITALNFHDIYNGSGPEAAVSVLETIKGMLKPGGVFGIIDHAGNEGADNASLHRIARERVIETAEAAGFVVEAESDILANPDDDRTQGVFAEGLRGNTDRFVVKLRKPIS